VVDAGRLEITMASAGCGGWSLSISATEFVALAETTAFPAGQLVVKAIGTDQGAPGPVARALQLTTEPQVLVSAPRESRLDDSYTYLLSLELTIPGGTLPGDYSSTVTVTMSAEP